MLCSELVWGIGAFGIGLGLDGAAGWAWEGIGMDI